MKLGLFLRHELRDVSCFCGELMRKSEDEVLHILEALDYVLHTGV